MDIAARRISKVIKVTKENEALKSEFTEKSKRLVEHIEKVEKVCISFLNILFLVANTFVYGRSCLIGALTTQWQELRERLRNSMITNQKTRTC